FKNTFITQAVQTARACWLTGIFIPQNSSGLFLKLTFRSMNESINYRAAAWPSPKRKWPLSKKAKWPVPGNKKSGSTCSALTGARRSGEAASFQPHSQNGLHPEELGAEVWTIRKAEAAVHVQKCCDYNMRNREKEGKQWGNQQDLWNMADKQSKSANRLNGQRTGMITQSLCRMKKWQNKARVVWTVECRHAIPEWNWI